MRQLSLWEEPQEVIHHHVKVWFRDYRPEVVYCTADPNRPWFTYDEVWSSQFVGRGGLYAKDCQICNSVGRLPTRQTRDA